MEIQEQIHEMQIEITRRSGKLDAHIELYGLHVDDAKVEHTCIKDDVKEVKLLVRSLESILRGKNGDTGLISTVKSLVESRTYRNKVNWVVITGILGIIIERIYERLF